MCSAFWQRLRRRSASSGVFVVVVARGVVWVLVEVVAVAMVLGVGSCS